MCHVVKSERAITENDIYQAHLVVFGTPQNSSLLAKAAKKLPVQFNENNIIIQSHKFKGENIAIRLLYPNPLNPEKYLVIFGASTPEAYQPLQKWQANDRQFTNQPEIAVYNGSNQLIYKAFFDKHWKLS
jgi:hypothetical protein